MKKCCNCNHTEDKLVKYYDKYFCEDCLEYIMETTEQILNVYWNEDTMDCYYKNKYTMGSRQAVRPSTLTAIS